ncbi:Pantetheinase, partial [Durusdinium trenchii]
GPSSGAGFGPENGRSIVLGSVGWLEGGVCPRAGAKGSMAEEPPMGFSVSPSVKLMLLQTHLAPPPVAEAAPTRAAELAAVLASLSSEGEDCRALLRRAAQSRQCDGGVEEELALAEEALDLSGAPGVWAVLAR